MIPLNPAVAIALLLTTLSTFAQTAKPFPVKPGGRIFDNPDVEALLARPYRADVPMASTGKRLWASHPDGWAFPPGSVHYYLLTGNKLGFDLQVASDATPIVPAAGEAYPSHVKLNAESESLRVQGAKWISKDDFLVSQLSFTNTAQQPVDVVLRATLPVEAPQAAPGRFEWSFDHAGMPLRAIAILPGFEAEPEDPSPELLFKKEGEEPDFQDGSSGEDLKAAASNGKVLGSGFGTNPGHRAVWVIDVKEAIENAVLTVRYARAMEGSAEVAVRLPNRTRLERRRFASTGGWGETEREFGAEVFRLGKLEPGNVKIEMMIVAAGGNVNMDALYIHPADVQIAGVHSTKTALSRTLTVGAGNPETLTCILAVGPDGDDEIRALVEREAQSQSLLADQVKTYNDWLVENVPAFVSADRALTIQYWHRATSVLKKNLFRVGQGRLTDWGISEGRWASSWYANMISYGGGHQIREARWLRDPGYVRGIITTWCANEKENGVFPNYIRPHEIGDGQYTDWITSTVWDAHCVHPDKDSLAKWADALRRNVDGWLATYDTDNDGLLLVDSHWWTGMEWQPSFFFFNDYDKDKQDQHLERVDLTAYVYGSADNLARILDQIGDVDGARTYADIARKIREAAKAVMWDAESAFFYSVEPETHEKALVKEVVGVYPFYFSMFDSDEGKPYTAVWKSILDPEQFWTQWPVASASKQCPAYSQDVNFNGKRVGGCMWNGPTWPHANSIVLSAMAATLREFPGAPLSASDFYALFRSYTLAQFREQDPKFPWTGEYYNGDTGVWRTGERDYNHSTYLDLVIADWAGLRPRPDETIELAPLIAADAPGFVIDGIRYHRHDISICWLPKDAQEPQPDGLTGFRVYLDGRLAHQADTPGPVILQAGG